MLGNAKFLGCTSGSFGSNRDRRGNVNVLLPLKTASCDMFSELPSWSAALLTAAVSTRPGKYRRSPLSDSCRSLRLGRRAGPPIRRFPEGVALVAQSYLHFLLYSAHQPRRRCARRRAGEETFYAPTLCPRRRRRRT